MSEYIVLFRPALIQKGFARGCAQGRTAFGGTSNVSWRDVRQSKFDEPQCQSFRERMRPILVIPHLRVAYGRPQLVSASDHPELWSGGRLLARLGQPRECGCRLYKKNVSPILGEM